MPEENPEDRQKQFLRALDSLSASVRDQAKAVAEFVAIAKKQIEMTNTQIKVTNDQIDAANLVFEAIMKPNDGAIPAIDDLISEVQGLRADIRSISKGTAIAAALGPILKQRR